MSSRHYLQEYLDKVKSLPLDVTRQLQLLQTEDQQAAALSELIDKNSATCRQICQKKNVTKEGSESLKTLWKEIEESESQLRQIADLKVNAAEAIYNAVDKHVRLLDDTLKQFEDELRRDGRLAEITMAEANARRERERAAASSRRRGRGRGGEGGGGVAGGGGAAEDEKRVLVFSDDMPVDPNEPRYCYCNQVSYGEMVACDHADCPYEWFHFQCVGITETPKGKWLCPDCRAKVRHGAIRL
eukprot:Rmarinus@m.9711